MFAVIKAGGKQYKVAENQVLKVEGLAGEPGAIVQIGDVVMLGGDPPQLGSPLISGASVAAEIIERGRGPKVIAFKKRRRKNSRRKRGHRQDFVLIRISEILTEGAKPTKGPNPKPETKAKAPEAPAAESEESENNSAAKKPAAKKRPARKPAAKGKKK
jgi:large subunit ribosomal protein L21